MHTARVLAVDRQVREARVVMGGVACRVCGGRRCALKDRTIRVQLDCLTAEVLVPGEEVRVAVAPRSLIRAAVRLVGLPVAAAALAAWMPVPGGTVLLAPVVVFAVVLVRGSQRRDLPRCYRREGSVGSERSSI